MMAGRITLLILMTGLFAAAWSSDRDSNTITMTAVRSRPATPSPAVRETALHRWNNGSAEQTASSQPAKTPAPRTIPAGTYLVVNPDGRSDRVVIAASQDSQSQAAADAPDHFVIEWNGQRQHWIRMTDSSRQILGHENVVVVLLDRSEIAINLTAQPTTRNVSHPMGGPSLQRLLSPLVHALTTLRNESNGPMAAEDAESVNR